MYIYFRNQGIRFDIYIIVVFYFPFFKKKKKGNMKAAEICYLSSSFLKLAKHDIFITVNVSV